MKDDNTFSRLAKEINAPTRLEQYETMSDIAIAVLRAYCAGRCDLLKIFKDEGWHEIATDKDGFALEEALDVIGSNLPILIRDEVFGTYHAVNNASELTDWLSDLSGKPQYYRWRKLEITQTNKI